MCIYVWVTSQPGFFFLITGLTYIKQKRFLLRLYTVNSVRGEACVVTKDSNKEAVENQSRLRGRSGIINCFTKKEKRELLHNAFWRLFTQGRSREGNKTAAWHSTGGVGVRPSPHRTGPASRSFLRPRFINLIFTDKIFKTAFLHPIWKPLFQKFKK